MTNYNRIVSIDIMRGLTLVLMLFVNDLNMKIAPAWMGHMPAEFDGMGLADWVFPGFLFMVGMAIPFALSKRLSAGQPLYDISKHILGRWISLVAIGVLMLNSGRVNPELTGMSKNIWALLMYTGVFLFWNKYPEKENNFFTVTGLKYAGLALLVILFFRFNSGQPVNSGSLITGWWGILGLIGWGYLLPAFIYLLCRESLFKNILFALLFLALNILSGLKMLSFLDPVKPYLGVIIEGNVPFIVQTGLIAGLLIKRYSGREYMTAIIIFLLTGIFYILAGFFLRRWFIISKIQATPSWGMICSGISFLVFILLYWLIDVMKKAGWSKLVQPAGENSLTTYLAPDILYYIMWSTGVNVLIYKESSNPWIVVAGSLIWAILMVQLTALLARLNIKLRL